MIVPHTEIPPRYAACLGIEPNETTDALRAALNSGRFRWRPGVARHILSSNAALEFLCWAVASPSPQRLHAKAFEHVFDAWEQQLNAAAKAPAQPSTLLSVGVRHLLNENIVQAAQFLLCAVDQQPRAPAARASLGQALWLCGWRSAALIMTQRAVVLNHENAAYWEQLATIQHLVGEHTTAHMAQNKAIYSQHNLT